MVITSPDDLDAGRCLFRYRGSHHFFEPPGLNKSKPVSSAKALINRLVTGPGTGDDGRIPFTSRTGVTQVALEVMKNSSD
jgi:hypothetical protein